jgi:hypothetical protein
MRRPVAPTFDIAVTASRPTPGATAHGAVEGWSPACPHAGLRRVHERAARCPRRGPRRDNPVSCRGPAHPSAAPVQGPARQHEPRRLKRGGPFEPLRLRADRASGIPCPPVGGPHRPGRIAAAHHGRRRDRLVSKRATACAAPPPAARPAWLAPGRTATAPRQLARCILCLPEGRPAPPGQDRRSAPRDGGACGACPGRQPPSPRRQVPRGPAANPGYHGQ